MGLGFKWSEGKSESEEKRREDKDGVK